MLAGLTGDRGQACSPRVITSHLPSCNDRGRRDRMKEWSKKRRRGKQGENKRKNKKGRREEGEDEEGEEECNEGKERKTTERERGVRRGQSERRELESTYGVRSTSRKYSGSRRLSLALSPDQVNQPTNRPTNERPRSSSGVLY
ncbi:uncharacterized protein BO80DRAFT_70131 [Aspergillus ibericus CBS 121593]|uniref:Uncharacterized protein n=1 Tax=Aspergillus ibericus CBS 121593 TaxID=1448316 RepID=A0A395GZR6_9EURO|nr:hypothetical protein BO80DRAFT_70131 [Aspergillus ibericus CBS 121593]RAL01097.1 hypothetical protein BO80DRAFT_70131 [Aspergillus ibericus CBS 121593]